MICDISDPAFLKKWGDAVICDATGALLPRWVCWADTESGEVAHVVIADEERSVAAMAVDDRGQMTFKKRWATYPAPLRLERVPA
jgi:hypothetical protein